MRKKRLLKVLMVASVVLFATAAILYRLVMPGALFLIRFLDENAAKDSFSDIEIIDAPIHMDGITVKSRIYRPQDGYDKVLLVVHGVHHGGYDEERMVRFVKELCRLGYLIVTPEIKDLKDYEISLRSVDEIHAAAKWILTKSKLVGPDEKIRIFGFSFAGGLSISAAARSDIQDRIAAVFSFGGHADLGRTLKYLCSGQLPDGGTLEPHVYGQAVIARQLASQLVPKDQVASLRKILFTYLTDDIKTVKAELPGLGAESRRIVELCLKRNAKELGNLLQSVVTSNPFDDSLSPIRGPVPKAALFLLHGSVDNVIPPSETRALAEWASGKTKTHALVTPLINHVELEGPSEQSNWAYWEIIRFWTELLRS
jgi:dienelactone hydrolase